MTMSQLHGSDPLAHQKKQIKDLTLSIIGLGYVGLPLAIEFGKYYKTIGFDLDEHKVSACLNKQDPTGEVNTEDFLAAKKFEPTSDPSRLRKTDIFIIAVPTPIDQGRQPDLRPLKAASRTVGEQMQAGAIVVFESTVYPGATEEVCVPILEEASGLTWKQDFGVGYSPERINPGDKVHTLTSITKVVSGDSPQVLEIVASLYESIVSAGVYRTETIKEAEAAKVIENTQRDLNIALMNELAIIFDKLDIDTKNVLQAAGSKWNFLPFSPGLVGGHCIGVDPYYLTHKAQLEGYHPQVILAGRRINDAMGKTIAEKTVKLLIKNGCCIKGCKVLVCGLTFKENCPDLRNSKVVDVIQELESFGIEVTVHDPLADSKEAKALYSVNLADWDLLTEFDGLVFAVPHQWYFENGIKDILPLVREGGVVVDVKSVLDGNKVIDTGRRFWRL
jgi:UDP-N-acetyl-D-galactosamine dehydrogenase